MRWLVVLLVSVVVVLAWQWRRAGDVAPPTATAAVAPPRVAPNADAVNVAPDAGAANPPAVADTAATAYEPRPVPESPPAATPLPPNAPPANAEPMPDDRPSARFCVTDQNGAPVGGACVTAIDGEHDLASGFADPAGELQLRGAASPFDYRVSCQGYLPVSGRCTDALAATRVVLPTAPRLRGRVFDVAGEPLYGIKVQMLAPVVDRRAAPRAPQLRAPLAFTDRDGRFELAWPDTAARDVVVGARGYAPFVAPALTFAVQGDALLVVTLQRGAAVQGVARHADGSPLGRAWVEVWSTAPAPVRQHFGRTTPWREHELLGRDLTAPDGAFEVTDLPAGTGIAVELAPEYGVEPWFGALAAGVVTPVDFCVPPLGCVRGTVVDWFRPTQVFLYGGTRRLRTTFADEHGSFEFRDVPPHTYRVGITMPPIEETLHLVAQDWILGTNSGFATEITLAPGEQRNLTLKRPPPTTGVATGTAFVGGQPAASCQVVFRPVTGEGALVRRAAVDADGDFGCEGLPAGDYTAELRSVDGSRLLASQSCRVNACLSVRVTLTAP